MLALKLGNTAANFVSCAHDLDKIKWIRIFDVPGISEKARLALCFFVANIEMFGASGIRAPLASICAAWKRAGLGPVGKSTLRASIAELETKGFVWRQQCRLGENRRGVVIHFREERFLFWTKKSFEKVLPIPTSPTGVYIDPYRQNLADDDRRNTQSLVNTCNININSNHARARGNNDRYNLLARNPILLTLWILLKSTSEMRLFTRAETEIAALEKNETVKNYSGVPWDQYAANWRDMMPSTRDSFAASQILPKLREASSPAGLPRSDPMHDRLTPRHTDAPSETNSEELAEIRRRIERSLADSVALPRSPAPAISAPSPVSLQDPDMRVLVDARERLRRRAQWSEDGF